LRDVWLTDSYDWLLSFWVVKSAIGLFTLSGAYAVAKWGYQLYEDRREHVPSFWAKLRFQAKNKTVLNLTVRNRSPNDITVLRIEIETPSFSGIEFADGQEYKDNVALHLPPGPPFSKDVPSETVSWDMQRAVLIPRWVKLRIFVFTGPEIDDDRWKGEYRTSPRWLRMLGLRIHGFWYTKVKGHGVRVYTVPVSIIETSVYHDEA
jgi:hypothetical protein